MPAGGVVALYEQSLARRGSVAEEALTKKSLDAAEADQRAAQVEKARAEREEELKIVATSRIEAEKAARRAAARCCSRSRVRSCFRCCWAYISATEIRRLLHGGRCRESRSNCVALWLSRRALRQQVLVAALETVIEDGSTKPIAKVLEALFPAPAAAAEVVAARALIALQQYDAARILQSSAL